MSNIENNDNTGSPDIDFNDQESETSVISFSDKTLAKIHDLDKKSSVNDKGEKVVSVEYQGQTVEVSVDITHNLITLSAHRKDDGRQICRFMYNTQMRLNVGAEPDDIEKLADIINEMEIL